MTDLTKEARGRDCEIRAPGCRYQPEYTVLCHVRMIDISGMGLKAPDLLGAFGCDHCHDYVDSRDMGLTDDERDKRLYLLLQGVMRTQAMLIREGKVKW